VTYDVTHSAKFQIGREAPPILASGGARSFTPAEEVMSISLETGLDHSLGHQLAPAENKY
jgi:hypothetical protein